MPVGFERDVVQEVAEIFGVSARDAGRFAVLDELVADEGAGGVEQTISQPPLCRRGCDQRFGEQVRDRLDRLGLADALA